MWLPVGGMPNQSPKWVPRMKTLRPIFTKTQLRRLARANGVSLDSFPSMLTVDQWTSVFDFMIRMVPWDRWPSSRREAKRESRRR
jgi:hypothetical protein